MTHHTYEELLERCAKEGISQKAIHTLLDYYTDNLEWSMQRAVDYAVELFENGTIALIKSL